MTDETLRNEPRSLLDRPIIVRAGLDSLRKLDPRHQFRNPVMFVVEIGAVIVTAGWLIQVFGGPPLGGGDEPAWFAFSIGVWLWLTVVFANFAEAIAEGRGKAQADALRSMRTETVARLRDGGEKPASELRRGDVVVVEAGETIPGDGTVIEGIASVDESAITGESAPVVRESGGDRSRRDRRHPGPLRSDRRRDHPGAGAELPRPDDRPGRGGGAAKDAERDRAQHPARRAHAGLPRGRRRPATLRRVLRHRRLGRHPDRAAGRPDPDHDRRPALGDRDRRHGPPRPPQRARSLGARGRGVRRRGRAAARQDRHDHARQPRGDAVHPDAGDRGGRAGRGGAALLARRRDARGPLDRRPRQGVRDPRARVRIHDAALRPLLRRNADERGRRQRQPVPQGRRRRDRPLRRRAGRAPARRAAGAARPDRPRRRHAARGLPRQPRPRRRLPEGHRQGGDARPLR